MASRRRVRYSAPPQRKAQGGIHFNVDAIPSWIAMLATIATLVGFYYSTNYSIADLKLKADSDTKARDDLRQALTSNAEKTSTAIAKLSEHAAVQDERAKNLTSTLDAIQGQLSSITTAVVPSAPTYRRKDSK